MSAEWTCYARSAWNGGRTCFHVNTKGITSMFAGNALPCCESCGATRAASDDRLKRGDVDKKKRL